MSWPPKLRFNAIWVLSRNTAHHHVLLLSGENDDLVPDTVANAIITREGKRAVFEFWLTRESATQLRDNLNKILEDRP